MRLFDASSVVEVLSARRGEAVELLRLGAVTQLTLFEVVNVIWRSRDRDQDLQEAAQRVREAGKVLGLMAVAPIEPAAAERVFESVIRHRLSFYDASYLYAAIRDGMTLVTEDEALRRAAAEAGCSTERAGEITAP